MPTTVVAQAGQTLCDLAIQAGFVDCQPIRDWSDNAGKPFLSRQLQPGDVVVIPDKDIEKHDKPVEQEHQFVKKNAPPVSVRFVHGSQNAPYRDNPTTAFLNVSNFITTKGGANGAQSFPTATTFDAKGDVDPDAFKLEVCDPAAGGAVDIKLEALKPVYDATGKLDHNEPFTGADAAARTITVTAKIVPDKVCFRSPYLRLVVDEQDQAALPKQALLVTDMADGNNGDNDKVEILDQTVRASYVRQKCPGTPKCTAVAEVPIAPDKQHILLCVHGVRANVGDGATAVGGVTESDIRRRTMKWFRRLYAQVGLSPKFVDPTIDFVDPPPDNMIVIGDTSGATASGVTSTGAASSLTFTLTTSPPRAAADPPDPVVTVNLGGAAAPLVPGDVGNLILAALPAGFSAVSEINCRATNAANGSCDVLISRADKKRVMITNESTNDTGLLAANAFAVVRITPSTVNIDTTSAAMLCCSMPVRRILRTAPNTDGRLDFYVTGGLIGLDKNGVLGNAARGLAQIAANALPPQFQPNESCRFSALMGVNSAGTPVMDDQDHDPYSYPHEAGHVLHDGFHTKPKTTGGATEMMTGDGTSPASAVGSSKRICDHTIKIIYAIFNPSASVQAATPGNAIFQSVNAADRIRANGPPVFGAF